jgi:predicted Zn-dependent protease
MYAYRIKRLRSCMLWLTISIASFATACASTRLPPIDGVGFTPEADEQELWQVAAQLDAHLVERDLLYDDRILEDYLSEVIKRMLVAMDVPSLDVSARAVMDPTLNAFALPNGSLYLHSGLMARIDNEAQLAFVLGHELEHYLGRHLVKEARSAENRKKAAVIVLSVLAVAFAAASGDAGGAMALLDLGGDAAVPIIRAQVSGYSRDLEREADARALDAMIAAGYDPVEAQRFFELMLEAIPGVEDEPFIYASHPHMEERLEYTEKWIAKHAGSLSGVPLAVGSDAYANATRELMLVNSEVDLRAGRPDHALPVMERFVAQWPDSARGYALLGQIHERSSDREGNIALAVAAFENATRLAPQEAEHHKNLGMLYRYQGRPESARAALERYIELAPDAVDRKIVERYLEDLDSPKPEAELQ